MKALFFDLDNTLYDNKQYFLGSFKDISRYFLKKFGVPEQKIYKSLKNIWLRETSYYPHLFDDLLKKLKLKDDNKKIIKKIIDIFNRYDGSLKPYKEVFFTLNKLKKMNYKMGIITDGCPKRQNKKIKLLGIGKFFEVVIFAKESEAKPSSKPFLTALNKINISPQDAFYVGDNPLVDFMGAKRLGMKTIRIKTREFKNIPNDKYIDFEIKKLDQLLKIIK